MALINAGGSVTTATAVTAGGVQIMLVNYSLSPARVFITPGSGVTLGDDVAIGTTSAHINPLARGVLVEGGETIRAAVTVTSASGTAADDVLTITAENVHTGVTTLELGVCLESDINSSTL